MARLESRPGDKQLRDHNDDSMSIDWTLNMRRKCCRFFSSSNGNFIGGQRNPQESRYELENSRAKFKYSAGQYQELSQQSNQRETTQRDLQLSQKPEKSNEIKTFNEVSMSPVYATTNSIHRQVDSLPHLAQNSLTISCQSDNLSALSASSSLLSQLLNSSLNQLIEIDNGSSASPTYDRPTATDAATNSRRHSRVKVRPTNANHNNNNHQESRLDNNSNSYSYSYSTNKSLRVNEKDLLVVRRSSSSCCQYYDQSKHSTFAKSMARRKSKDFVATRRSISAASSQHETGASGHELGKLNLQLVNSKLRAFSKESHAHQTHECSSSASSTTEELQLLQLKLSNSYDHQLALSQPKAHLRSQLSRFATSSTYGNSSNDRISVSPTTRPMSSSLLALTTNKCEAPSIATGELLADNSLGQMGKLATPKVKRLAQSTKFTGATNQTRLSSGHLSQNNNFNSGDISESLLRGRRATGSRLEDQLKSSDGSECGASSWLRPTVTLYAQGSLGRPSECANAEVKLQLKQHQLNDTHSNLQDTQSSSININLNLNLNANPETEAKKRQVNSNCCSFTGSSSSDLSRRHKKKNQLSISSSEAQLYSSLSGSLSATNSPKLRQDSWSFSSLRSSSSCGVRVTDSSEDFSLDQKVEQRTIGLAPNVTRKSLDSSAPVEGAKSSPQSDINIMGSMHSKHPKYLKEQENQRLATELKQQRIGQNSTLESWPFGCCDCDLCQINSGKIIDNQKSTYKLILEDSNAELPLNDKQIHLGDNQLVLPLTTRLDDRQQVEPIFSLDPRALAAASNFGLPINNQNELNFNREPQPARDADETSMVEATANLVRVVSGGSSISSSRASNKPTIESRLIGAHEEPIYDIPSLSAENSPVQKSRCLSPDQKYPDARKTSETNLVKKESTLEGVKFTYRTNLLNLRLEDPQLLSQTSEWDAERCPCAFCVGSLLRPKTSGELLVLTAGDEKRKQRPTQESLSVSCIAQHGSELHLRAGHRKRRARRRTRRRAYETKRVDPSARREDSNELSTNRRRKVDANRRNKTSANALDTRRDSAFCCSTCCSSETSIVYIDRHSVRFDRRSNRINRQTSSSTSSGCSSCGFTCDCSSATGCCTCSLDSSCLEESNGSLSQEYLRRHQSDRRRHKYRSRRRGARRRRRRLRVSHQLRVLVHGSSRTHSRGGYAPTPANNPNNSGASPMQTRAAHTPADRSHQFNNEDRKSLLYDADRTGAEDEFITGNRIINSNHATQSHRLKGTSSQVMGELESDRQTMEAKARVAHKLSQSMAQTKGKDSSYDLRDGRDILKRDQKVHRAKVTADGEQRNRRSRNSTSPLVGVHTDSKTIGKLDKINCTNATSQSVGLNSRELNTSQRTRPLDDSHEQDLNFGQHPLRASEGENENITQLMDLKGSTLRVSREVDESRESRNKSTADKRLSSPAAVAIAVVAAHSDGRRQVPDGSALRSARAKHHPPLDTSSSWRRHRRRRRHRCSDLRSRHHRHRHGGRRLSSCVSCRCGRHLYSRSESRDTKRAKRSSGVRVSARAKASKLISGQRRDLDESRRSRRRQRQLRLAEGANLNLYDVTGVQFHNDIRHYGHENGLKLGRAFVTDARGIDIPRDRDRDRRMAKSKTLAPKERHQQATGAFSRQTKRKVMSLLGGQDSSFSSASLRTSLFGKLCDGRQSGQRQSQATLNQLRALQKERKHLFGGRSSQARDSLMMSMGANGQLMGMSREALANYHRNQMFGAGELNGEFLHDNGQIMDKFLVKKSKLSTAASGNLRNRHISTGSLLNWQLACRCHCGHCNLVEKFIIRDVEANRRRRLERRLLKAAGKTH